MGRATAMSRDSRPSTGSGVCHPRPFCISPSPDEPGATSRSRGVRIRMSQDRKSPMDIKNLLLPHPDDGVGREREQKREAGSEASEIKRMAENDFDEFRNDGPLEARECLFFDPNDGTGEKRRRNLAIKMKRLSHYVGKILSASLSAIAEKHKNLGGLDEDVELLERATYLFRDIGLVADPEGTKPMKLVLTKRGRGRPSSPRVRRKREDEAEALVQASLAECRGKHSSAVSHAAGKLKRSCSTIQRNIAQKKKRRS